VKETFVISYDFESNEGFDLALIGTSFVGFDKVMKELLVYAGLTDKVEVRTTRVKQGSVDVFNAIFSINPFFIQDPMQLLEFLKIAGPELTQGVNGFLAIKKDLNDYYADNPLDFEISLLVTAYLINSIRLAGKTKQSDKSIIESTSASPRQIARLRKMVNKGFYKKALLPITQGNVTKVKLSAISKRKKHAVTITDDNVGDFLPDTEQILPQFNDGDFVTLSGELQMLGSTHGDSMKIRVRDIDPKNNLLEAKLSEGLDIIDYRELFKQGIYVEAEIRRKNMFKKPELIIYNLASLQEKLELITEKETKPKTEIQGDKIVDTETFD